MNSQGYPNSLSNKGKVFGAVLKGENSKFTNQSSLNNADYNATIFTGPASNPTNGIKFTNESGYNNDIPNRPDKNDFWLYVSFSNPVKACEYNNIDVFSGDLLLIDVNGTNSTNYNAVTLTCN